MDMNAIRTLALEAHRDQVDKADRDYFDAHLVPIAAAAAVFGEEAEAAGWLHDILEDTEVTAAELEARGVPGSVVDAVASVTRRPDETYEALIERSCADPLGRLVKLADNAWNVLCNPLLAASDPAAAEALLEEKYLPARTRLLAAAGLEVGSTQVQQVEAILRGHLVRLGTENPPL